jgi:hypothetical protein
VLPSSSPLAPAHSPLPPRPVPSPLAWTSPGGDELGLLPLAGHAFVDSAGATVLEINADGKKNGRVSAVGKGRSLYGAHGVVWSADGIARLFGGAVLNTAAAAELGAPAAGDVVVGGDAVVTSFRGNNLVAHPSKVRGGEGLDFLGRGLCVYVCVCVVVVRVYVCVYWFVCCLFICLFVLARMCAWRFSCL